MGVILAPVSFPISVSSNSAQPSRKEGSEVLGAIVGSHVCVHVPAKYKKNGVAVAGRE